MSNLKKTILSCLFSLVSIVIYAQGTIYTKNALQQDYIGTDVYIFQDSTNTMSLAQIKESSQLFKISKSNVPNLGITTNNSWIRFTLINNSSKNKFILNLSNPIIDEVSFYVVRDQKTDSLFNTNYAPLSERPYKHQFYLFDISIDKGDSVTCYLKLKSSQQILAPLSLNTGKTILSSISVSDIRSGIYMGIMLVMLFYNLFIYFTVRDKEYLVYCHYIFWVTLTQATLLGFSHRYLWPNNAWLAQYMVTFCGAMSGIATLLFAKSFLRAKIHIPRLNKFLSITIIIYLISILLLFSGLPSTAFQLVNINAALVSISIMIAAWMVYRMGYVPATYFLISWSVFFVSILIFVSKDYGIVPYNQVTVHAVEIGSALEAVFLSFALASKINILKKEKEISQAESLEIAKENERIVREQNVILETKVNERTVELTQSNEGLNKALIDLKEAEIHLIEAEKMASLGQLTAGIAHEINNPINFITSNVNPLKRDINQLLETIQMIEEVSLSSSSTTEKQAQISDYKEEIDFDYLKTEIDHLLNGIHNGASRTAEIVKGLRVFSRLDEDDRKAADINEGLDSTLIIVNNQLNNSIKVIKNYGDLPLIECYPGKLNQVFLNILSNAIYAINKQHGDKKEGWIKISTGIQDEHVFITFEDNGIGMDENTKKKIFEPFFTTKDVGDGTGLGMSIVYNTIQRHEGKISVNSTPQIGTEFSIELPIQKL